MGSGETGKGGWAAAAAVLAGAGVRSVFGLPGDDLDALAAVRGEGLGFTLCRDQRNAVFMATGYAIQSGALGVAVVGKGPAVTNTVTGLLEARCSAAPVLVLSGGTSAEHAGSGAFQELDQVSVLRPLVKWAARVEHPSRLVPLLRQAILAAQDGVPGPVYLELPDHLAKEEIPVSHDGVATELPTAVTLSDSSPAVAALRAATRPTILVGGGMRHRNAGRRVERLAEAFGAAVACTASGRGAVDEALPLFCGLSGLYTPEPVGPLWTETDCVLVLGSRLEETATFGWPDRIGKDVPVVQVNLSAGELSTEFGGPAVIADAGTVVDALLAHAPAKPAAWAGRVAEVHRELRTAHQDTLARLRTEGELCIAELLEALDEVLPADRILVQENGLQDMWSYRFPLWTCSGGAGSVVPSEQTSLGFGAAAAVGVRQAAPDRPVVAFVGDGAFGLFAADLPTAVREGGLLYVVLRNGGYGWLQAQLDQRDGGVPGAAFVDEALVSATAPELPGLHQRSVTGRDNLRAELTEAWKLCAAGRTVVLDVPVRLEDSMFGGEKAGGDFPLLPGPA
ncbi:thiamine pyrophosphate-binding protein [Amycolatopsis benzoatilytica]|uniref:thiamine pyrophosphate-binding protein n=1 Tax=Amycolatopsis benzoatilytica TaxID=346045 RepID=UPI00039A6BF8|nr:thiamine pyrophosphate-binding protein [Amycolatopsis benzoatilytica]